MAKKTVFSILLIVLGVGTGLLVIFAYLMSGGKASFALPFLGAAIVCIIVGTILGFSRLLDRSVNPILDELHRDIEDDLQDLKEHRITSTAFMVIVSGVAALIFSFFVFRFHKLEAMWGAMPVAIPTLIAIAALAWFIPRTNWFQSFAEYTPMWVFLIPTAGLIFTLVGGITKTENLSVLRASPQKAVGYNTFDDTGYFVQQAAGVGEWGLALPDCEDEFCLVFLVIALIILVFVLVIGSAYIPHFWLLSGSIMLGIMALIAIHDLRIRPKEKRALKSTPA